MKDFFDILKNLFPKDLPMAASGSLREYAVLHQYAVIKPFVSSNNPSFFVWAVSWKFYKNDLLELCYHGKPMKK